MAPQRAGWYPDPNDSKSEVYWDGTRWHGRRDKLPQQAAQSPTAGQPRAREDRGGFSAFWDGLDDTRRVFVIFGAILLTALIAGLIGLFALLVPPSAEDECTAVAERNGLSGSSMNSFVDICVDNMQ